LRVHGSRKPANSPRTARMRPIFLESRMPACGSGRRRSRGPRGQIPVCGCRNLAFYPPDITIPKCYNTQTSLLDTPELTLLKSQGPPTCDSTLIGRTCHASSQHARASAADTTMLLEELHAKSLILSRGEATIENLANTLISITKQKDLQKNTSLQVTLECIAMLLKVTSDLVNRIQTTVRLVENIVSRSHSHMQKCRISAEFPHNAGAASIQSPSRRASIPIVCQMGATWYKWRRKSTQQKLTNPKTHHIYMMNVGPVIPPRFNTTVPFTKYNGLV
jgi:hypothetical protein